MKQEKTKSRMPQIGEAVFCIAYLVFDLIAAIVFLSKAGGSQILNLFGVLTLVLGGGRCVPPDSQDHQSFSWRFAQSGMVGRSGADGLLHHNDRILCAVVLCLEGYFPASNLSEFFACSDVGQCGAAYRALPVPSKQLV